MARINFSPLDYLAFISLLCASALIGVFFWYRDRKNQSNKEYLTGGRSLSVFPVSMSLAASFMSTNTLLGVPAEIFLLGTQFYVNIAVIAVAVLLAANVFLPIYYDLELTSVAKYLLRRFNANSVRLLGSIGFIMCTLPYMGVVLYGPSLALSSVTPLSIPTSILVVGTICTFYTAVGGIKAVIWTDVIQCLLMILGLVMVVVSGLYEFGFVEPFRIVKTSGRYVLLNLEPNIYRSDTFWAVFCGTLVGWTGTYCVKQTQVQRYCCLESKAKARKALYWNIPGVMSIAVLSMWCGIFMIAKYHNCDPVAMNIISRYDQLMPYFVMEKMGKYPGVPGVFVACVFSGSLSTLSSGYNAMATVVWDDFIKRLFTKSAESKAVTINKIVAATFGLLSMCIAFVIGRLGTVLQASIAMAGAVTGPLLGLFCLGIFCPCVNAKGAFAGLISGLTLCLTIAIGSIINERPKIRLPTSTQSCNSQLLYDYGRPLVEQNKYYQPSEYSPEGINRLFHVSYYLVPLFGFLTCITIGVLVSLITGRSRHVNPKLVSPIAKKLFGRRSLRNQAQAEKHKLNELNAANLQENIVNNQKDMLKPVVDEVKRRLQKEVENDNPLQSRLVNGAHKVESDNTPLPSTYV